MQKGAWSGIKPGTSHNGNASQDAWDKPEARIILWLPLVLKLGWNARSFTETHPLDHQAGKFSIEQSKTRGAYTQPSK